MTEEENVYYNLCFTLRVHVRIGKENKVMEGEKKKKKT